LAAAAGKLDRRAKTAVAALALAAVAVVGLVIRNSVIALTPESTVAAPTPENQDELIEIGGHTLLLEHGSAGNRIAHWLHAGSKDSRAFEMGTRAFVPNADALTAEGKRRVRIFVNILNHVQTLKARILVSTDETEVPLEQARAVHLRSDMVSNGIPALRVSVSDRTVARGKALSQEPELLVVLSK
jgi:hypothetical protein